MAAKTMKDRADCGCVKCMHELGQAVFAHLVDREGFAEVSVEALDELQSAGTCYLSAEVTKEGRIMVRVYNAEEVMKEMRRG